MMDLGDFLPDWAASLVSTLGLYFVLFIVGYFVINFVQKNPVNASDRSLYARFARWFVFGYPEDEDYAPVGSEDRPQADDASTSSKDTPKEMSYGMKALLLAFCTCGLLGSYLLWGVLQERVMTTDYTDGRFKSSTFLVFCNRLLALIVAIAVTSFTEQPKIRSPHYKYSFTSLSNVLSSWCQLEALKYISFPTQVLAKSSKMIPVMIMGKVISRKSYPMYDYIVAVVIGLGVAMFTLYSSDDSASSSNDKTTSISGIILIVGYLTFDSFTSQWQGHLFREYKMSSYQMMYGVNYFSCLFTFLSLLQSQELFSSITFIMRDPIIGFHIFLFSVAGATGQMFIFYTIKQFGPLVFTMIMTTRQLIAIILSCILYGHALTGMSMLGAAVVFGAVIYRIYRQQKDKKEKKSPKAVPPQSVELKISNKA